MVGVFRKLVTAKVNIGEDQFLRECPEYFQLPRNKFSTLFPGHLVSMICLMSTKMALGSAVNSFKLMLFSEEFNTSFLVLLTSQSKHDELSQLYNYF